MSVRIALAGNPNSGKTTLFNNLTGGNQYVGNWPGVTVEKKEGKLKKASDITLVDLPGVYSLSPYTLEEVVARDFLLNEKPDAIVNIVDATNLERNLYLTTQLLEIGIPVIVALNMMDVVRKGGDPIDAAGLASDLGCDVMEISALKGSGLAELVSCMTEVAASGSHPDPLSLYSGQTEKAIKSIEYEIAEQVGPDQRRFLAIKLFERDSVIKEKLGLDLAQINRINNTITDIETAMDDDSESIITAERYNYVTGITSKRHVRAARGRETLSDRIDRVVTNRILAMPIFIAVMFLVYYISVTTVGTILTDLTNDTIFGAWIMEPVAGWLATIGTADWLSGFIVEALIGGVGAVIGFVPQMFVLFFILAILEDCGYMARIAFIMDRIFRRFGLSGKSFIPVLIGTGCGVPGIMASRTIENQRDRRMTIITTTFIPCGAKLPIIALIAGALFSGAWWVAPSAYFVGIAAILVSGIILKKTRGFAGDPAPFVMELPTYHLPSANNILRHTWDRGFAFIKKAGTIIFVSCAVIWFLSSFGFEGRSFGFVETPDSLLAGLGSAVAPLFVPLGWGDWRATVATITGLVAKENVVGTFGVLYGMQDVAEDGVEIWASLSVAFTGLAAYSFLLFNLLCAPCFAAIGAIRREMANWKWTLFAVGYQTLFAYAVSFGFYQIGRLVSGSGFTGWSALALAVAALFVWLLVSPGHDKRRTTAAKMIEQEG